MLFRPQNLSFPLNTNWTRFSESRDHGYFLLNYFELGGSFQREQSGFVMEISRMRLNALSVRIFVWLLIHFFNRYFPSTCDVVGSVLGPGVTAVSQATKLWLLGSLV